MRLLRIILPIAIIFMFFACKNGVEEIIIVSPEGVSGYVIVRSDTADQREIDAAVKLRDQILNVTGVKLAMQTDWIGRNDVVVENAPEIVIGITNRSDSNVSVDEYSITVEGARIFISASPEGINEAVETFIQQFVTETGISVPKNINILNKIINMETNKEVIIMSDPGYIGKPVNAKIIVNEESGIPQIYLDGEYVVPTVFFGNTDIGRNVTEQAALAAAAGIHLHSVIYNINFDYDIESYNFQRLRDCMDAILRGDPYGKIILRVNTGAYYNPAAVAEDDWRPQNRIEYVDGSFAAMASTASDKWAEEATARLQAIVKYMRTSEDYADHLICIHLEKGEWFEQGFREYGSDVSETNSASFRNWLRGKYQTDDNFRAAWGVTYAISDAAVPRDLPNNTSDDHSYPNTMLLTPKEQKYVDYFDYIGELVSGRIDEFAKAIKEVSDNEVLVIAFYGYVFELSDAQSGHYNMKRLLESEYLDGFAAPVSYADRTGPNASVGATSAYMTAADSVMRHGKLWFQESDQRTFVNNSPDETYLPKLKSLEDIYQVHRREIGMGMVHGNAVWAMDLGATGWLLDQSIWDNLASLSDKYAEYILSQKKQPVFDAV
ncbi:MAG: beta-galactosidase, partial [Oscillospiraceae bacterium]|nr:beta-galactosidase [Oscillospiraceae bacterium]